MNSFYATEELTQMGFKSLGQNVLISKKTSIYFPEKISIGNNVRIDDFTILSGVITLGNYIHIAPFCAFFAGNVGIEFKDYVTTSSKVSIYAITDDYSGEYLTNPMIPLKYRGVIEGKVILEKHAIIGASSVLLPGVIVGEGSSVGAMSLVNKSITQWTINVGVPAREIKERSKKLLVLEEELIKKEVEKSEKR